MQQCKVLLITTGGTIAGKVSANKKEGQEIKSSDSFSEMMIPVTASFENIWKIDVKIDHKPLKMNGEDVDVDSSDIIPEHWVELANIVKENYDNYDSFIITHGTNTLGYTCSALSFAFLNPNKPIVLTGSQVPAGMAGSDAEMNLVNALRVAVWPREKYNFKKLKGVLAVFGSHIITGTRVKKDTEFDYDAFKSFGTNSIGRIGRIININEVSLNKHLSYLRREGEYHEAIEAKNLRCENSFDMRIASLTEFPGMSSDIFKALVDTDDIKGFVFRAFGAGDVSTRHHEAFKFLKGQQIPIVVTTQAPNGNANFQVNEPGQYLKDYKLAIPAHDMSVESQVTKLSWLLARKKEKKNYGYEDIVKDMVTDLRGEISPMLEVGQ